jgi:hypothetical protein
VSNEIGLWYVDDLKINVVAYFNILPQNSPVEAEESHEKHQTGHGP